mmetsp:Transcript_20327/g.38261  ORF Transcript_20327/g.38261 Transcript_20327/m.38261 type:complete len:323 (-) Transcript_20327:10-978(-)
MHFVRSNLVVGSRVTIGVHISAAVDLGAGNAACDIDEALVGELRGPAVLHDPIVPVDGVSPVPNEGDGVVDPLALDRRIVAHLLGDEAIPGSLTAFRAHPEDVGVDARLHRAVLVDERSQLLLVRGAPCTVGEVAEGRALDHLLLAVQARVVRDGGVHVRPRGVVRVIGRVDETVDSEVSELILVPSDAVDQFLLREVPQPPVRAQRVLPLRGGHAAERPAVAMGALILRRGDSALGPPVHGAVQGFLHELTGELLEGVTRLELFVEQAWRQEHNGDAIGPQVGADDRAIHGGRHRGGQGGREGAEEPGEDELHAGGMSMGV